MYLNVSVDMFGRTFKTQTGGICISTVCVLESPRVLSQSYISFSKRRYPKLLEINCVSAFHQQYLFKDR